MAESDDQTPRRTPEAPPAAPTTGTTGGAGAPQSPPPGPGGGADRVPRDRPLISDRPAGADLSNPPAVGPDSTGPEIEAAGEARGFSPMKWIPVLLFLILVLVLLFTQM